MKRFILSLSVALCLTSISLAQTAVSSYIPGVTAEGAIYFLPKTGIRITVCVEKTTYTPGDLCKYAERYLRIKNVSQNAAIDHRIISIKQEAFAVADTSKRYAVKFDAKTTASNVRLSGDGVLMAINTDYKPSALKPLPTFQAPKPALNPHQYLSEETLAAGSTSKMAELIALDIYEIRESRNLLTRGQADFMPQDGEQLRLMLNKLEEQDLALTSLFTGTTICDTTAFSFTVIPDEDIKQQILFRFSQKLGIVAEDDLSGSPYYINIEDLKSVPPTELLDPKKKHKQVNGIYINVPGKLRSTISNLQGRLLSNEFPAGQFGNVELLSGALFNKRYTTRLLLNPISGAVESLDAEQPK